MDRSPERHPGDLDPKHHHGRNRQGIDRESLTSFEASLEEARRNNNDEEDSAPLPIDAAMVDDALTAVAIAVFPHRVRLKFHACG
jgi:hypothetical protein